MAWAVAYGHRTDDPVASVDAVLPKQDRTCEHRKALPYAEVPQAITTAWMRPCMAFVPRFETGPPRHGVERDVAEAALAHAVRNAVEAAYLRTDYLEKCRGVMERWAKHCEPKAAAA